LASRKRGLNWRLGAVVAAIALATLALTARLVQLQILDHDRYASEARNIHEAKETVAGRRGALLDRNGYPLAASAESFDVIRADTAFVMTNLLRGVVQRGTGAACSRPCPTCSGIRRSRSAAPAFSPSGR